MLETDTFAAEYTRIIGFKPPAQYLAFLQNLGEEDSVDIRDRFGNGAYFYGKNALAEHNKTYQIAQDAPGCCLIGQDSDTGLFLIKDSEAVYSCGLGALDSMMFTAEAPDFDSCLRRLADNQDPNRRFPD